MEDYAATIKTLGKFLPTVTDYETVIVLWQSQGVIIKERCDEIDSIGKLHVHLYIQVPATVRMFSKKFRPEGYHIWLEKITNSKGWLSYMRKCQAESKKPLNKTFKIPDEDSKDRFKEVVYKNGTKVLFCRKAKMKEMSASSPLGGTRNGGEPALAGSVAHYEIEAIPLEDMDIVTQQEFLEWRNLRFGKKLFR